MNPIEFETHDVTPRLEMKKATEMIIIHRRRQREAEPEENPAKGCRGAAPRELPHSSKANHFTRPHFSGRERAISLCVGQGFRHNRRMVFGEGRLERGLP
jgi:hypothetical protein